MPGHIGIAFRIKMFESVASALKNVGKSLWKITQNCQPSMWNIVSALKCILTQISLSLFFPNKVTIKLKWMLKVIYLLFYATTDLRPAALHFLYPVRTPHKCLCKSVIVMCLCMCFCMCFRFSFHFCYVDQLCFYVNKVIRIKLGHRYQPQWSHISKKTIFAMFWIPPLCFYQKSNVLTVIT